MSYEEIRAFLAEPQSIRKSGITFLRLFSSYAAKDGYNRRSQELLLRLLEIRGRLPELLEPIDALARQFGLFPYVKEPASLGLAGHLAYELHRPLDGREEWRAGSVVFHREQAAVYHALMAGDNVILSAPTSFGKSLIVDAIVASGRFTNIVAVVPTLALVDETRRRLAKFHGYKVITHGAQRRASHNIFVLTQERVLDMADVEDVDFFVIDEFYKLSPELETEEEDARATLLNQAFYRLRKSGAQFYMLGPNIQEITEGAAAKLTFRFMKTDYATVVTEVESVPPGGSVEERLVRLAAELKEPTIIYCKSPARASEIGVLLATRLGQQRPDLEPACDWIGTSYHPDWSFVSSLRRGVGIHHGHIPRALAQYIVREFNAEHLRYLVCTSTLIEGVNTKAKNIVILDNKIGQRQLDFFTFNNIRGRSGRMFEHFIGRVYLFHPEPHATLPMVDVPVLSQPESTSTTLLMQVDDEDLTERSRERISPLLEQGDLSVETMKANSGVDPAAQIRLAQEIKKRPHVFLPLLQWTREPAYEQLVGICRVIRDYQLATVTRGVSDRQAAFLILSKLKPRTPLSQIIQSQVDFSGGEPENAVSTVLRFIRNYAMFNFPKGLRAVDRVQAEVLPSLGKTPGSYEHFARRVENLFYPAVVTALDEYGVPFPLATRLMRLLPAEIELDDALDWLRRTNLKTLRGFTSFETDLLLDAQRGL